MSAIVGFIFFTVICKPLGDVACCFLATLIITMSRFLVNMHCNRFTNQIDECRKSRAEYEGTLLKFCWQQFVCYYSIFEGYFHLVSEYKSTFRNC